MKHLFDVNGHLNAETVEKFYHHALSLSERKIVADHMAVCPLCADAAAFAAAELHQTPQGFEEQILLQVLEKEKQYKQNRTLEFLFYSLRVAAAAGFAIALLCSGWFHFIPKPEHYYIPNFTQKLNQTLNDFSNRLLQTEEYKHEKTKK